MPAIQVKNLTAKYGDLIILDKLSFSIENNSICAVIGPNGSGKTTLLKAMLGLIPFSGEVLILNNKPSAVRPNLAYVPQRFTFDKTYPITVAEFLKLSLDNGHKNADVNIYLKEVGLLNSEKKLLGELSGGQLQRILIARALVNEPKIIFFDEPAAGIDISGERNFYDLIKHLNQEHGLTVVLVSHEIDIVFQYATQVICLNKKLICTGRPQKVINNETLKSLYGQDIALYHHKYPKHD